MEKIIRRTSSSQKNLKRSLKEMKLIRKGILPKETWGDLKNELNKE